MSNFDDEIGDDEPSGDDWHDEAVCRFSTALDNVVNYHVDEYDLSHASVVGVLFLHVLRWGLAAVQGPPEEEFEGDGDEGEDDPA